MHLYNGTCKTVEKKDDNEIKYNDYFRNNFNQFNQYWIEEESMEVVPTVQRVEEDR